jgi:transposase
MKNGRSASDLAAELGVHRSILYLWKREMAGSPYRRPKARLGDPGNVGDREAQKLRGKIVELERQLGRKSLEIDFFKAALRKIEELRQKPSEPGVTASSLPSKAKCGRKAN